jgi:nicotinate-nucleotide pyrophosphorylase (carboxylating)
MINRFEIDELIKFALKEDIALGDITTDNLIDDSAVSSAVYIAKQSGIIAGLDVSERVFKVLDDRIEFIRKVEDGAFVNKGDIITEIKGSTRTYCTQKRKSESY